MREFLRDALPKRYPDEMKPSQMSGMEDHQAIRCKLRTLPGVGGYRARRGRHALLETGL